MKLQKPKEFQAISELLPSLYRKQITTSERKLLLDRLDYHLRGLTSSVVRSLDFVANNKLPISQSQKTTMISQAPLLKPIFKKKKRTKEQNKQGADLKTFANFLYDQPEKAEPQRYPRRTLGRVIKGKIQVPRTILPKEKRINPLSQLDPINQSRLNQGIFNLVHQGWIPFDINYDNAFQDVRPLVRTMTLEVFDAQKYNGSKLSGPSLTLEVKDKTNLKAWQDSSLQILQQYKQQLLKQVHTNLINKYQFQQKSQQIFRPKEQLLISFSKGLLLKDSQLARLYAAFSDQEGLIRNIIYFLQLFSDTLKLRTFKVNMLQLIEKGDECRRLTFDDLVPAIHENELLVKAIMEQKKIRIRRSKQLAIQMINKLLLKYKKSRITNHFTQKGIPSIRNKVWKLYNLLRTKVSIRRNLFKKRIQVQAMQLRLQKTYGTQRPLQIHIPSMSISEWQAVTTDCLKAFQFQINRILRTGADVAIVLPYISKQTTDSIYQLLSKNEGSFKPLIIVPQMSSTFSTTCLAKVLYYSTKALRLIKQVAKDRLAYIVPGRLDIYQDYINLSEFLKIPLLCARPEALPKLINESYLKKFLYSSEIPTLPYEQVSQRSEQQQIYRKLTLMLMTHKKFSRWVLRIKGERRARGIAHICFQNITNLNHVLNKSQYNQDDLKVVYDIVSTLLTLKLQVCFDSLYRAGEFLATLAKNGGFIEPQPLGNYTVYQLCYLYSPSKKVEYLGTVEHIRGRRFVDQAFKNTFIPWLKIDVIGQYVVALLSTLQSFSYFSLKLVSNKEGFWCTRLFFEHSPASASLLMLQFLQRANCAPLQMILVPFLNDVSFKQLSAKDILSRQIHPYFSKKNNQGTFIIFGPLRQIQTLWLLSIDASAELCQRRAVQTLFSLLKICMGSSGQSRKQGIRHDARNFSSLSISMRERLYH